MNYSISDFVDQIHCKIALLAVRVGREVIASR